MVPVLCTLHTPTPYKTHHTVDSSFFCKLLQLLF